MLNLWTTLAKIGDRLMDNEEILQKLSNIDKKLDKVLNLTTKIAKTLHLLPVTEKEERDIQILQRKNLATAAKITNELDAMENKTDNSEVVSGNVFDFLSTASDNDILGDIIGDDYLGSGSNGNA